MTYDEARSFIESVKWTFAKTMPNNPHEYIIREKVDITEFNRLYEFIYDNPTWIEFHGTYYRTITIDTYMYWIMPKPQDNYIINRKKVNNL